LLVFREEADFDFVMCAATLDFDFVATAGLDVEGLLAAAEDDLAFDPVAVTFLCFRGAVPLAWVFAACDGELAEGVCASPARGETHAQISARAQAAPSHFPALPQHFRFGSKSNPSKLRLRAAPKFARTRVCSNQVCSNQFAQKTKPNGNRHCNHPPSREAMPVPIGLIQVTEVFRP
jgi:hypothetical protein